MAEQPDAEAAAERSWPRTAALVLALGLSVLALLQAHHRAGQGRGALLKWGPVFDALERGDPIYQVGAEGYPTLPLSLLLLQPFHRAGESPGPWLWAVAQVACAWWIVTRALALPSGRARDFPAFGTLIVILLSFRVLLSDVLHGNLNLLVGASIASAAWEWRRGHRFRSGLWIGFGAVLKVTPALGIAYFAWKRSRASLAGAALGLLLFAFVLPGLWLGTERNSALAASWWEQMIEPYLSGRALGLTQTEHINQSMLGVLARFTTDCVAIVARPPVFESDVRIHLIALGAESFRILHVACAILVLVWAARCIPRGRGAHLGLATLGEFSTWTLAMVFLSERSWKHHYVLLAFPLAFLALTAAHGRPGEVDRRMAIGGLLASTVLHALSGSGVLGARGSDLAEAYGAWFFGGAALFLAVGEILHRRSAANEGAGRGGSTGPRARVLEVLNRGS